MDNWFPGHIARASKEVDAGLKRVDVVIEVADARAPLLTRYGRGHARLQSKRRILVLTRTDLAETSETQRWLAHFRTTEPESIQIAFSRGRTRPEEILGAINRVHARSRPPACMVVGLPNVGKSTVLNVLAGHKKARTGALPGITRGVQWLECPGGILVLDLPGIVVPRRPSEDQLLALAALGIVPEAAVAPEDGALWLIDTLGQWRPTALAGLYGIAPKLSGLAALDEIAFRRGALLAGGAPDRERAARTVLNDFRDGRLGRLTVQRVPEESDAGETCASPPEL